MQSTPDLRTLARKVGFDPAYLEAFEAKMFIEGPKTPRRLTNFFVLLLLATVIATFGVLSDSTATVIGALENQAAVNVTDEWLADTSYQVVNVAVRDEQVTVAVEGQGELRPLRQLAGQLAQRLERPIWVKLRIVPSQVESSG
jgi:hypothetical protein